MSEIKIVKFSEQIWDLPDYIEKLCLESVTALRAMVSNEEAPVRSMNKSQLIGHLTAEYLSNRQSRELFDD